MIQWRPTLALYSPQVPLQSPSLAQSAILPSGPCPVLPTLLVVVLLVPHLFCHVWHRGCPSHLWHIGHLWNNSCIM